MRYRFEVVKGKGIVLERIIRKGYQFIYLGGNSTQNVIRINYL